MLENTKWHTYFKSVFLAPSVSTGFLLTPSAVSTRLLLDLSFLTSPARFTCLDRGHSIRLRHRSSGVRRGHLRLDDNLLTPELLTIQGPDRGLSLHGCVEPDETEALARLDLSLEASDLVPEVLKEVVGCDRRVKVLGTGKGQDRSGAWERFGYTESDMIGVAMYTQPSLGSNKILTPT